MKKLFGFIFSIIIACTLSATAYSNDSSYYYTCYIKENLSEEAEQLNIFLAEYFKAVKNSDIRALKKLYADTYVSGDGFDKEKLMKMIADSWHLSKEMQYSNEIEDVRLGTNFATVEITENSSGLTKIKSDITKDNGIINSTSKNILYLQKLGKGWKIISDKTLWEEASIKFGDAKDLDIALSAPEQVFKDKNYSISLETKVPEDTFILGSIANELVTYPRKQSEEVIRQVPAETSHLERVVKANNKSRNELAIASVSLCAVKKGEYTTPQIDISGTAVILKRVNVE